MNKYNKIANELIKIIGEDNIISITHCATRLRVMVKDREIINDKKVEKVDEVKGVFFTSGQYQIILGTGIVNKVYAEVEKMG
ncbi:PTS transporter subunit EIIB, partial [Clostridioides difficile]